MFDINYIIQVVSKNITVYQITVKILLMTEMIERNF